MRNDDQVTALEQIRHRVNQFAVQVLQSSVNCIQPKTLDLRIEFLDAGPGKLKLKKTNRGGDVGYGSEFVDAKLLLSDDCGNKPASHLKEFQHGRCGSQRCSDLFQAHDARHVQRHSGHAAALTHCILQFFFQTMRLPAEIIDFGDGNSFRPCLLNVNASVIPVQFLAKLPYPLSARSRRASPRSRSSTAVYGIEKATRFRLFQITERCFSGALPTTLQTDSNQAFICL